MSRMTALVLQMFARTVWSDDILAQTIADLILHFRLVSLKTLGTRGSRNSSFNRTLAKFTRSFTSTEKVKLGRKSGREAIRHYIC